MVRSAIVCFLVAIGGCSVACCQDAAKAKGIANAAFAFVAVANPSADDKPSPATDVCPNCDGRGTSGDGLSKCKVCGGTGKVKPKSEVTYSALPDSGLPPAPVAKQPPKPEVAAKPELGLPPSPPLAVTVAPQPVPVIKSTAPPRTSTVPYARIVMHTMPPEQGQCLYCEIQKKDYNPAFYMANWDVSVIEGPPVPQGYPYSEVWVGDRYAIHYGLLTVNALESLLKSKQTQWFKAETIKK